MISENGEYFERNGRRRSIYGKEGDGRYGKDMGGGGGAGGWDSGGKWLGARGGLERRWRVDEGWMKGEEGKGWSAVFLNYLKFLFCM